MTGRYTMVAGPTITDTNVGPAPVIKQDTIRFDDIGYPGWWMVVRTNPSAEVYDAILDSMDESLWEKFASVVVDWNFPDNDEPGARLGPPTAEAIKSKIPWDIRRILIRRYFDLFREKEAPKDSGDNSTSTSTNAQ